MVMSAWKKRLALVAAVVGVAGAMPSGARAEVKLSHVIGDHMVLQQGMNVPIWGWADAGENVTVSFAGQKETATPGADGKWEVKLKPLTASDRPAELVVAGKNTITVKDILVGEVWVCSGQSNMEFRVAGAKNHDQEIKEAAYPNIRFFSVKKKISLQPDKDVPAPKDSKDYENQWEACSPETVGHFSAVGYFFGRDLNKDLKVPIGLIHTSWGGTPAEAWTPVSYMEKDEWLAPIVEHEKQAAAKYPKELEAFNKNREKLAAEHEKKMAEWKTAAAEAKAAGKPAPKQPVAPQPPAGPGMNSHEPAVLYNGMIAPIVPVAIRGAIWYQGESNAGKAYQYRKLLPTMIQSWRDAWAEPEMSFLIVNLANYQQPAKEPGDDAWAELREAQTMTAAMPHNGQALAIDLADAENPNDIHPKNKQDVGHRLALVAEAKTYGKKEVVYSGPEYEWKKIEGNKVEIKFRHADGLEAKGGKVTGFQIAGEDKKWHWADAELKGDEVMVSSAEVAKPVAVRYAWSSNPVANLYNKAGLPAVPFRTDDWEGKTANAR